MQELHTWIGATDPTSQAFRLQNQNLEQLGYTVVLHQTQHKEGDIDTSRRETEGAAGRTVDPTTPHRESKKVKDLHSRSTQSERLDKDGDARRAENLHNTKLLRKLASRQERRRNQEAYCDPDYKSSAENKANSCQHTISSPPRKSKPSNQGRRQRSAFYTRITLRRGRKHRSGEAQPIHTQNPTNRKESRDLAKPKLTHERNPTRRGRRQHSAEAQPTCTQTDPTHEQNCDRGGTRGYGRSYSRGRSTTKDQH